MKNKYSTNICAPIYEPKNKKPVISSLYNKEKTDKLIYEIENSNLSNEDKEFLKYAAYRHIVFNYEKIADYYSHASIEVQGLMEMSALVVIDFNKAIEGGFVKICNEIKKQFLQEYGNELSK